MSAIDSDQIPHRTEMTRCTKRQNSAVTSARADGIFWPTLDEHGHAVRIAVGIHYGEVIQGDVGSEKQLELTLIGDTVNIASRVEGYCRTRALEAIVDWRTLLIVHDAFEGVSILGLDHKWHEIAVPESAVPSYSRGLGVERDARHQVQHLPASN